MLQLNRSVLTILLFFSQTHNSKAKSHMLLCSAVLPACCLTLLISLHIFICFTIGKKPFIHYRQDTWRQVFTGSHTAADFVSDYIQIGTTTCLFHLISSFIWETHDDFINCSLNFILKLSSADSIGSSVKTHTNLKSNQSHSIIQIAHQTNTDDLCTHLISMLIQIKASVSFVEFSHIPLLIRNRFLSTFY